MAKVGDKICVKGGLEDFFTDGEAAILSRFDGADWWATFCDGEEWCVGKENSPVGFIVTENGK